jgi:Mg/Co/Ni transporter MgtE
MKREQGEEKLSQQARHLEQYVICMKSEMGDEKRPHPAYADPIYRISRLASSARKPLSVSPDTKLEEVVTHMLTNDFSQLPVMTSGRDVKGVITWASIGSRLAVGKKCFVARELMEQHQEIRSDASFFSAIGIIAEHQYVLVRGHDQKITGIVTASDLSLQFQQLAEPFLLLGEIENHVRRVISQRFTPTELESAKDPTNTKRVVTSVADLTYGEYIRLLENPERWDKLNITVDRKTCMEKFESVRKIRNDVMHFDPEGIPEKDLMTLREFARFLQRLQIIDVINV